MGPLKREKSFNLEFEIKRPIIFYMKRLANLYWAYFKTSTKLFNATKIQANVAYSDHSSRAFLIEADT